MIFEASRAKAVDQLNNFIEQNLTDYSKPGSYSIPYDGPSKSVFEKWLPFSKDK